MPGEKVDHCLKNSGCRRIGIPGKEAATCLNRTFGNHLISGAKANGTAKAAAPATATIPPSGEREELIAETRKQIRRALLADVPAAESWKAINLDMMTEDELRDGLQTIKEAIQAAVDA